MEEKIQKILTQFSLKDIRKLKQLLSIIPDPSQDVNFVNSTEVVTLRLFSDEYSKYIQMNLSKAYFDSVLIALKHLTNYFGLHKSIQSLGFKDIEKFVTHLQQKVPQGYRVYVKTLKAAMNKAINWGYITENYFLKIKLPRKQQIHPAYINESQLFSICEKIDNENIREIVIVAFYTGMRLNELLNINWRNVNLSTKIITIGGADFTTKTRGQRFVPISDEVYKILHNRFNKANKIINIKNDYVFLKPNHQKYSGDHVSKTFKRACKAAGMDEGIHFHSLRHSTASNLAQKGVSLYTIKALLGHSSITTTEIYSHLNMDSLKEAIKVFD